MQNGNADSVESGTTAAAAAAAAARFHVSLAVAEKGESGEIKKTSLASFSVRPWMLFFASNVNHVESCLSQQLSLFEPPQAAA